MDVAVEKNQHSEFSSIAKAIAVLDQLGKQVPRLGLDVSGCDDPIILAGCGSYTYPLWFLVSLVTDINFDIIYLMGCA